MSAIKTGSVLRSTDKRDKGRTVRVVGFVGGRGDGETYRIENTKTGRRTFVTLRTIRMTYAYDSTATRQEERSDG